jgi:hypothetical protein
MNWAGQPLRLSILTWGYLFNIAKLEKTIGFWENYQNVGNTF